MSGLTSGATYYFRARSTTASDMTGYSPIYSFTTLDTTPPVISSINVTPARNNTATVTWSVSKPCTTQVEYGTDMAYGLWSAATQVFSATLGWVPSGTIHYRIHSTDPSGNQAVSPDFTFVEP